MSSGVAEKQQLIQGIMDVLQRTYGDASQTALDRKVAESVLEYVLSTGAATASGVAILVAAAGGRITIPDSLMVDPPTGYWTTDETVTRARILTVKE